MAVIITKIAIVLSALLAGIGFTYFVPGAKDDNPIEEKAEEVIKNQTGLDIDLTPRSPEVKIEDATDMVSSPQENNHKEAK